MKRLFKIVLILLVVVLLIVLVGPFLIPVRPLEGLTSPTALAQENSQFLTLAFPGTDGIDIHYRRDGEGEPAFILLHGFAGSLFTWDTVFDDFAAKGQTLAYDRPPVSYTHLDVYKRQRPIRLTSTPSSTSPPTPRFTTWCGSRRGRSRTSP